MSPEAQFINDWYKRWEAAGGLPGKIRDEWAEKPEWIRGTVYRLSNDINDSILIYWAELPAIRGFEKPQIFADLLKELDQYFTVTSFRPINRDLTVYRIEPK